MISAEWCLRSFKSFAIKRDIDLLVIEADLDYYQVLSP